MYRLSKLQNSCLDKLQTVQRLVLVPVVGGEPEEHSLVQLHAVQLGPAAQHCFNYPDGLTPIHCKL